ncbi:Inosine-5'-monophosphate dehydrogenase [Polaribacter huanghezhanensis]|uniref:CBS domain-containing protein n=1 Tax=Polaribacter huanghezhanensis TaxID=1354726 RepID=UPI00264785F3|nr:CBS domain-containing protein [Polaribacter huanghezhanensis]WKD85033.1 Inosine-5'-monophosphate dehydrogenase [Polaribacter huanghezhanensis]
MNIIEYILNNFKPLTTQSTVREALKLCKTYPITHIPVVENARYVGCISQTDVLTIDNKEELLIESIDIFDHFQTDNNESLLELLKIFADNETNILPAVANQKYLGYIDLNDVLDTFSQTPFLNTEGVVLVIEKNSKDYSMSEVSQIIESNNGVVLGCYESKRTSDQVEVTLKVSSQEINEIIQTFRRYNYTIISEHKDDIYLEELKNRSDYLQKFLNT